MSQVSINQPDDVLRQFHQAIPCAAVGILVTTICALAPDWNDDNVVAVAPLLLSLTNHPDFLEEHARAVTKCATSIIFGVVHRPTTKPGEIATYALFGDILSRTLSLCEWPKIYSRVLLSIVDDLSRSRIAEDRLIGIKILQGLAQSPGTYNCDGKWILPRYKAILHREDVNLGDAVFACACAIKRGNWRLKMQMLWSEICTLWYDSGLDERRDRRLAVASLCEMFRGDAYLFALFNEQGQRVGELMKDICAYTREECAQFESGGGEGDATYLRCVANEMATLVKLMTASGNAEIRREALAMYEELRKCTDGPVNRACALRFAALHPLLHAGEVEERGDRKRTPRLPNLKKWGEGIGMAGRVKSWFGKVKRFCGRRK